MKMLDKQEKAELVESLVRFEREDRRESWRKYYMRDDYIALDPTDEFPDGVVFEYRKPYVKSEFWYDDEYDSPLTDDQDQRKAYFIAENMRWQLQDYGTGKWLERAKDMETIGCCLGDRLDKPFVAVWGDRPSNNTPHFIGHDEDFEHDERSGMRKRVLSEREIEELLAIIDEQRAKFAKRLETYWKRYSDKVCAHGYWANR